MSLGTETGRFVGLDGLRGMAALAVFVHHAPDKALDQLLPSSYLAVDLFFLLSGFVLTYAYERQLTDGLSVIEFMRIRLVSSVT